MNTTPRTTGPARSTSARRRLRGLAIVATAVLAATTASIGLGFGPSTAEADPGDTFLPIGSSQLLQSEDLSAIRVTLDTETVVLNRDDDFSSCLGEGNHWTEVLIGAGKPVTATWTSRLQRNQAIYESIGQAKTAAQAKRYAATLLRVAVQACQGNESPRDFYYGRTASSGVDTGFATWAVSYRGREAQADGGVVVFSKGTNFGFIEVNGTWGPAGQTMESVAKVAVNRLA